MKLSDFEVPYGTSIKLIHYDTSVGDSSHPDAEKKLKQNIERLASLQDVLSAQQMYSVLIIFQAMDAAGKDSIIKHVMTGLNPQGCHVVSFKEPSAEELRHDYLWRCTKELPEKGRIGIFNRSYYEEVLIVRVHPELLEKEHLPRKHRDNNIWEHRFDDIAKFERHLARNGTIVLKFFLHVSKEEQKKRFLERLDEPDKHWKFSLNDLNERKFWDDYQHAYAKMLGATSTKWAPWYIVPADQKWFTRLVVSETICRRLEELHLSYPQLSKTQRKELQQARHLLASKKS